MRLYWPGTRCVVEVEPGAPTGGEVDAARFAMTSAHPSVRALLAAVPLHAAPVSAAPRSGSSSAPSPFSTPLFVIDDGAEAGLVVPLGRRRTPIARNDGVGGTSWGRSPLIVELGPSGAVLHEPLPRREAAASPRNPRVSRLAPGGGLPTSAGTARLLPAVPRLPPPHPRNPQFVGLELPNPPVPWLPLLGACAPLCLGLVLWAVTGAWFMLLFGAFALFTGGIGAIEGFRRKGSWRRAAATGVAQERRRREAESPGLGVLVASWRERPAAAEHDAPPAGASCLHHGSPRIPLRLGRAISERVHVGTGEQGSTRGVALGPAPFVVAIGQRRGLRVAGSSRAVRSLSCALLARLLDLQVRGALRTALEGCPWLPVETLALSSQAPATPDDDSSVPVVEAVQYGRDASGREETVEFSVGGAPEAWIDVDADAGTASWDGRTLRFVADELQPEALRAGLQQLLITCLPRHASTLAAAPALRPLASLSAIVGHHDGHPVELDLVSDGPHALIVGTTGSGKSASLLAWLRALMGSTSPNHLRLLLFDFKGGSTFSPLRGEGHVEGVVTDLDAGAAEDAVESLAREIERRERWMAQQGLADISEATATDAPPRLVVAVDEFRVLATSAPETLDRLIHLATVGRSLGIHLILCTQHPQGVVTPSLRANLSIVWCLRVASEAESVDLLGSPVAARLPAQEPGSGYLRIAGGAPNALRSQPGGDASAGTHVLVTIHGPSLGERKLVNVPIEATLAGADERVSAAAVGPSALPATTSGPAGARAPLFAPRLPRTLFRVSSRGGGAPGLARFPGREARPWVPDAPGSAVVLCSSAAAAAAASVTLARWVARRGMQGLLHDSHHTETRVVILDGGAGSGASWPVGCERVTALDQAGAHTVLDSVAAGLPHARTPTVVHLLAPQAWIEADSERASMRREQLLRQLVASPPPGVSLWVFGAATDPHLSRLSALASRRLYLPYGVGPEHRALWPRLQAVTDSAESGVWWGSGLPERGLPVCLAIDPEAGDGVRIRADTLGEREPSAAALFPPLPPVVDAATLPSGAHALGFAAGAPLRWSPGRVGLVLGGQGSGKSSVLSLLARRPPSHGALLLGRDAQCWPAPSDTPETTWLVDDADLAGPQAVSHLRARAEAGGRIIAALAPKRSALARLSMALEVDQERDVVLLGPRSRSERDVCGLDVPVSRHAPPGRGWLPTREGLSYVQFALAD